MSSTNLPKNFIIFLFCLFILTTSGCDNPIVPPVNGDDTYNLTIISQSDIVFGTVYVDGISTGETLPANDSIQISGVEPGSTITIKDSFGFESHSELFEPPNTNIVFTYF